MPDPRIEATADDLRAQFQLLIEIRDRLSLTHTMANQIASLRAHLAALRSRGLAADLVAVINTLDAELELIDGRLIQRAPGLAYAHPIQLNAKLAALAAVVGSADAAPTRAAREVYAELSARLDTLRAQYQQVQAHALPALNHLLVEREVPVISPD